MLLTGWRPSRKNWMLTPLEVLAQHLSSLQCAKVGVDIWTPNCSSLHGYKYVISFIDHHSSYLYVYLMQQKSQAYKGLTSFLHFCRQHRLDPQCFRLDNDKCFKADNFTSKCSAAGILLELSSPHSPHQNGLIGRTWRTLAESTFTMMETNGLLPDFWEYAVQTVAYLHNRTWRSSFNGIPYHIISYLANTMTLITYVFGCPVWGVLPASQ